MWKNVFFELQVLSLTNMLLLAVNHTSSCLWWVTLLLISGEVFGSQSGLNVSYPPSSVCPACSLLKHAITDFWVCRVLVKTKSSVDPCHLDSPRWTDFLLPTSSLVRFFVLILSWTVETPLLIWSDWQSKSNAVLFIILFELISSWSVWCVCGLQNFCHQESLIT